MRQPETSRRRFAQAEVNEFFQFELEALPKDLDGVAVVSMPVRPEYRQEGGVVHGGVITSLADTATAYSLAPHLEEDRAMTGIEFKMNFLRPSRIDGGPLKAHAKVVRRGRRIGVCSVDVRQDEKLVATGIFTYLVFARSR